MSLRRRCKGQVRAVLGICWPEASYDQADFTFDPLHYPALLEQKTGALDQAAPLAGWELPGHLRRLMEARMDKRGRREFVQVLRLLEAFPEKMVAAAVIDSIRLNAIGFDAVKQLALCRLERRPARLDLSTYPHLPKATVQATAASDCMALISTEAVA